MNIRQIIGHSKTVLKTNAPTIMVVGGVGLTACAIIFAVKAKEKADGAKLIRNDRIDSLMDIKIGDVQTEEQVNKEIARAKIDYGVSLVKAYSVPVTCELVGMALIFGSHSMMQKRCAALVTAYNMASATLTNFYEHVKEELGQEKTDILMQKSQGMNKISPDSIYEQIEQDNDRANPYTGGGYWVDFCPATTQLCKDDYKHDLVFIKAQEMFANDRLKTYGVVTLNEVLDSLGMDPTDAGLVVGWSTANGDDYVDFGLDRPANKTWHDTEGRCGYCTLAFNTKGVIYGTVNRGLYSAD